MSSWINWLWRRKETEAILKPQIESTTPDDNLEDGWLLLLGEDDNIQALHSNLEHEARKRELEILAKDVRHTGLDSKDLEILINNLRLSSTTPDNLAYLDQELESDMRFKILKQVIKEWGEKERTEVSSKIFWEKAPKDSKPALEVWNEFNADWPSKSWSQGHEGVLTSYAAVAYNGGLTTKNLKGIFSSISKSFQIILKLSLYVTLTKNDLKYIEDSILCILKSLIQKHIEAVKISMHTRSNIGRLPLQYAQEKYLEQQRIANIKKEGVDAKWEEHKKKQVDSSEMLPKDKKTKISHKLNQFFNSKFTELRCN